MEPCSATTAAARLSRLAQRGMGWTVVSTAPSGNRRASASISTTNTGPAAAPALAAIPPLARIGPGGGSPSRTGAGEVAC